jgi:hypothetical protein
VDEGGIMNSLRSIIRSRTAGRGTATFLSVVLTVGITISTAPTAWGAGDPEPTFGRVTSGGGALYTAPALTRSGSTPITRADAALARARAQIQAHHPLRAIDALLRLRINVIRANRAARDLIGKPPTDPESDDPPGPPAVFAALALDHRIASGLVPLFDGRKRADVVDTLGRALYATQRQRNRTLDRVIALPAEGDGADYADDMADRLGAYPKEVQQLRGAVLTYRLTPAARWKLNNAYLRAIATNAKVVAAFGGGE